MAQKTNIEWTDYSINPIRARDREGHLGEYCEKISPGCANCYSSKMQARFRMPQFQEQRKAVRDGTIEVFLDEKKLHTLLHTRKPAKVFPGDMTDMFGEWVPDEWLDKIFATAALTPHLTYQILTKRPERMLKYFKDANFRAEMIGIEIESIGGVDRFDEDMTHRFPLPLKNVWLGVSVEDQATADERIHLLLQTPAAVRFVSYEPALGPVDFTFKDGDEEYNALTGGMWSPSKTYQSSSRKLDWIIFGGESGPKARPCNIQWARDVRDQCEAAGTAFFMKQMGPHAIVQFPKAYDADGHAIHERWDEATRRFIDHEATLHVKGKGGDMDEWPEDLRVREFPTL